ncbi:MAG: DUF4139 domain-containing protein [Flavobacteriales bacterium]|nr:DUF4139 domain-containing protein [Flavobacteriales bacterium]
MRFLFITIFSFCAFGFNAQSSSKLPQEKIISSKIKDVTVFLSGAQIHRTASVTLDAGNNLIKFEGLAKNLNGNSIQVGGNKEFTIVSVNYGRNYMKDAKISPKLERIKDSLIDVKFKLELRNRFSSVYMEEKSLLLANKSVGGSQTGVDVEDLIEIADLFRSRLREIEMRILDISEEQKEFKKTIYRLQRQLNQLNVKARKSTTDITIRISTKVKTNAKIFLSYIVTDAGWTPIYDVRSKGVTAPINLVYKGNVWQTSGNDWNNVKVTLSTGNPSVNNTAPKVDPWVLGYYDEFRPFRGNVYKSKAMFTSARGARADTIGLYSLDFEAEERPSDQISLSAPPPVAMNNSGVNTEFKIQIPYTITSDGQYNAVEIQSHELKAEYQYYVAPKFDKDAFLIAKVTDWDQYNLLSGSANIYYEGTFVGSSFIDASITKDTMEISLGRDKGVIVERKKIKDFGKTATVGNSKKSTIGMEITIRNSKNTPIQILVHDQIPISKIKEIEVTMIDNSSAKYNENSGALKWRMSLQPGQSNSVQFKYQVKYPKSKTILNL